MAEPTIDSLPSPIWQRTDATRLGQLKLDSFVFYSVPWVATLTCVHGLDFGPMRHTGLLWLLTLFLCLPILLLKTGRRITFPWYLWAPLYMHLGLSLFWSDFSPSYNIQLYVQMTVYFAVGMVASLAVRSEEDLEPLNRSYLICLAAIGAAWFYYTHGPGKGMGVDQADESLYVGFASRVAAMSLIVVAAVFLAQIRRFKSWSVVIWFSCFAIALFSGSRGVTLVILLLWLIHPQLARPSTRIAMALLTMLIGLAAFNTSVIQDRFFQKDSGFRGKGTIQDVLQGKFDSAGRFDSWPKILEASREQPWFGHGVGQSIPFVYRVWAPMDKPHNEFLKMYYDGGLIAMWLYIFALLGTLVNLWWVMRVSAPGTNWAASAAFMGMVGFLLLSFVDNPLVCGNNFLHPVFALVGAANAVAARQRSEASFPRGERLETDATTIHMTAGPAPVTVDSFPEPIALR
jgi:O-antigen ligase